MLKNKLLNNSLFYFSELLHFIILIALPLYLLYTFFTSHLERRLHEEIIKTNTEITKILPTTSKWDVITDDSVDYKITAIFNNSFNYINQSRYIHRSFLKLNKRFPKTFKWAVFSEKNKLLPQYSNVPQKWYKLLQEIPQIMLLYRHNRLAELNPIQKQVVRRILGITNLNIQFKNVHSSKYLEGSFSNVNTKVYISKYLANHPWFICWISFKNRLSKLVHVLELERLATLIPRSEYKLINLQNTSQKISKKLNLQIHEFVELFKLLNQNFQDVTFYKGYIWKQYILSKDEKYRWIIKIPVSFFKNYIRYKTILVLLLIISLITLSFFWIYYLSYILRSSTRFYVATLFIYVIFFPLVIFGIFAPELILNIKHNEQNKIFTNQTLVLQDIDRQIFNFITNILDNLEIKLYKVLKQNNWNPKAVYKILDEFSAENQISLIELFNSSGKSIYSKLIAEGETNHIKPLITLISKICGQKIHEKNMLLQPKKRQNIIDLGKTIAFKAILESLQIDYNKMFSAIETALFVPISIQSGRNYVRLIPIYDKNIIRYAVLIYASLKELSQIYLNHLYTTYSQKVNFSIFDSTINYTSLTAAKVNISPKISENETLYQAIHKSLTSAKEYLITIIRGKNIYKIALGCIVDDSEVKKVILKVLYTLVFIGMCIVLISIYISKVVSSLMFKPFRHLEYGLQEVSAHNFRVKLPVEGSYEFIKLIKSFNDIIEGLSDLEIGKVVQDTFFPTSEISNNNWQLYGRVVNASRVGGDYIDYFQTKEGKWLIIIGDVAGHGVSAALVVAMIKAVINVEGTTTEPILLIEMINKIISLNLQRKKFMTCCITLFDPVSGELELVNGAHSDPYLVIKWQEVRPIVCRGFPLGFGYGTSRHKWNSVKMKLEDGDAIIFYTDGLVEARLREELAIKHNSQVVGFDLFQANLPNLISKYSAKETEENIRRWHSTIVVEGEVLDDISIVVLQSVLERK